MWYHIMLQYMHTWTGVYTGHITTVTSMLKSHGSFLYGGHFQIPFSIVEFTALIFIVIYYAIGANGSLSPPAALEDSQLNLAHLSSLPPLPSLWYPPCPLHFHGPTQDST